MKNVFHCSNYVQVCTNIQPNRSQRRRTNQCSYILNKEFPNSIQFNSTKLNINHFQSNTTSIQSKSTPLRFQQETILTDPFSTFNFTVQQLHYIVVMTCINVISIASFYINLNIFRRKNRDITRQLQNAVKW